MKVLLSTKNEVLFIGEDIQFGEWENEVGVEKWKITDELYAIDNGYVCKEVTDIPEEVEPHKYCYTENDGFYLNPDYVEPAKPTEERVIELEQQVAELTRKLTALLNGSE